jgi:hypothetical protein
MEGKLSKETDGTERQPFFVNFSVQLVHEIVGILPAAGGLARGGAGGSGWWAGERSCKALRKSRSRLGPIGVPSAPQVEVPVWPVDWIGTGRRKWCPLKRAQKEVDLPSVSS